MASQDENRNEVVRKAVRLSPTVREMLEPIVAQKSTVDGHFLSVAFLLRDELKVLSDDFLQRLNNHTDEVNRHFHVPTSGRFRPPINTHLRKVVHTAQKLSELQCAEKNHAISPEQHDSDQSASSASQDAMMRQLETFFRGLVEQFNEISREYAYTLEDYPNSRDLLASACKLAAYGAAATRFQREHIDRYHPNDHSYVAFTDDKSMDNMLPKIVCDDGALPSNSSEEQKIVLHKSQLFQAALREHDVLLLPEEKPGISFSKAGKELFARTVSDPAFWNTVNPSRKTEIMALSATLRFQQVLQQTIYDQLATSFPPLVSRLQNVLSRDARSVGAASEIHTLTEADVFSFKAGRSSDPAMKRVVQKSLDLENLMEQSEAIEQDYSYYLACYKNELTPTASMLISDAIYLAGNIRSQADRLVANMIKTDRDSRAR